MINSPLVRKIIALALEEDLVFGDITTNLCIPEQARSSAYLLAKEDLVVCGLGLIGKIFFEAGCQVDITAVVPEGEQVTAGTRIASFEAASRDLLMLERTILNFLQRLSGVATCTRKFVERSRGLSILDTRKTLPGWRLLDKYAARIGGASNHRLSLSDMIMVKNNHVDAAHGSNSPEKLRNTMTLINRNKPLFTPVEVEVRDLEELRVAVEFGPEVIMLDNMNDSELSECLKLLEDVVPRPLIEVSGGMTMERLEILSGLGVDCVSIGALTTSARNVDISLTIIPGV